MNNRKSSKILAHKLNKEKRMKLLEIALCLDLIFFAFVTTCNEPTKTTTTTPRTTTHTANEYYNTSTTTSTTYPPSEEESEEESEEYYLSPYEYYYAVNEYVQKYSIGGGYARSRSRGGYDDDDVSGECSETTTREIVSFYTNPAFPRFDSTSKVYKHSVTQHKYAFKAVRFEFLEAIMAGRNTGWDLNSCNTDSFQIVNCAEGATAPQCGLLKGYQFTVLFKRNQPVVIVLIMQSVKHAWKIKITQIEHIPDLTGYQRENCGIKTEQHEEYDSGGSYDENETKLPIVNKLYPQFTMPSFKTAGSDHSPFVGLTSGENNVQPHKWPWQVLILFKRGNSFFLLCSGSIIDECHVVTAAYCVQWDSGFANIDHLYIYAGKHDLSVFEPGSKLFEIESIKVNAGYKAGDNDISVLKLKKTITFTNHILPVCLPPQLHPEPTFSNEKATMSFWGVSQNGQVSPTLNEMNVTVMDNEQCETLVYERVIKNSTMCTSFPAISACNGEGGGPLMLWRYGQWECVGVFSFGFRGSDGRCRRMLPVVFTRITFFLQWIAYNIAQDKCYPEHSNPEEYYDDEEY